MVKRYSAIVLMAMVSLSLILCGFTYEANAETNYDQADYCFLEYFSSEEQNNISFTRYELYNSNIEQNGWQYNFTLDEIYGYALITLIELNNGYFAWELEEIYVDAASPFDCCVGKPIYVAHGSYIDFYNEVYYNLIDGNIIDTSDVIIMQENGFGYLGANFTEKTETINFARKESESYNNKYKLPVYSNDDSSTGCANVAGAIVVGYYDMLCENLIPDYKTYVSIGSTFKFKAKTNEIDDLIASLHTFMGTDNVTAGTTFSGFQNGMTQYVNEKGYEYKSDSLIKYSGFSFSNYKTAIQSDKIVALFLSAYDMTIDITESDQTDTVKNLYSNVGHVAIGYGYRIDTYYNSSNQIIDTRNYLAISSGFATYGLCYLSLNSNTKIDEAEAISII